MAPSHDMMYASGMVGNSFQFEELWMCSRRLASWMVLVGIGAASVLAGRPATATATLTAGAVRGVTVTDGGAGYSLPPGISFNGGGGIGTTAVAVMAGDRVEEIIVLNAGSGYQEPPLVTIEPPPSQESLTIELIPKITVSGPLGTLQQVEWSPTLESAAEWQVLTNVTLGSANVVVVDLEVGSATRFYRAITLQPAPAGMVLIPGGDFQMGNAWGDGFSDERPVHAALVSPFYMDTSEVTKVRWDEIRDWSLGNGYGFDNSGNGKAPNHPVHFVNWYDAVKWCNARSQKDGRVPSYYTDSARTQVYKTGRVEPYVRWTAGYRLPTEAEWEKAARGGSNGHRFPWSNTDTISHSQANYYSYIFFAYDVSPTAKYHPSYAVGTRPYTSPVGSFTANGYGLYDPAGNVSEWCWDWYGTYPNVSATDPRGPITGSHRVYRGGGWDDTALNCRTAARFHDAPSDGSGGRGFRTVLPSP